jgi:hypothetical protein
MEIIKIIVQLALVGFISLIIAGITVRLSKRLKAEDKEKKDREKAETLKKELEELAKWKVPSDEVYVINGRLEMSIHAMVTLFNNPDYIAHLREEAVKCGLHESFFEHQLEIRINKAKYRIQERINVLRERNEDIKVTDKLKALGIQ